MVLPPVAGAMCWFAIKVGADGGLGLVCFRMVRPARGRCPSVCSRSLVLLFSLRPILSDLHHGNNNLVILFLVVAALYAWRQGYDVLAGLLLGLAISYKVTPALSCPTSPTSVVADGRWRLLGLGIFLLIVPSLVIGPQFNGECLGMWWHRMVSPFVVKGVGSPQEINQSMVGVLTRLLTDTNALAKAGTTSRWI